MVPPTPHLSRNWDTILREFPRILRGWRGLWHRQNTQGTQHKGEQSVEERGLLPGLGKKGARTKRAESTGSDVPRERDCGSGFSVEHQGSRQKRPKSGFYVLLYG